MKLLLVTGYFPPDGGSAARLAGDLARHLSGQGDAVEVLAPPASYLVTPCEMPPYVRVHRRGFSVPPFLPHLARRAAEHFLRPWAALLDLPRLSRPDAVFAISPPAAGAWTGLALARRFACPLIMHVQDLFPHNAVDLGAIPAGLPARLLEAFALVPARRARLVLVHAPGAGDYFRANGVAAVTHLPNWVGTARFAGHDPSEARQELLPGLEGKLVALFAGVLGPAQGLDSLVALAAALQDREDIRFVFAGEGACRAWLAREVRALSNVTLLPFQPPEVYPRLVAASDVFLVSLSARVRYPVIPSKIGDGLAAGKALLAALPGGDAATLVRDAQAGVVVEPGDAAGLARALCELAGSPRLRARLGESGRRFARTHLERELVLARARSLLVDALQGAP